MNFNFKELDFEPIVPLVQPVYEKNDDEAGNDSNDNEPRPVNTTKKQKNDSTSSSSSTLV